jgi:hypothetical protein
MVPRVGEEEVAGAALFIPESLSTLSSTGLPEVGTSWAIFSAMECRAGVVAQQAIKESSKRLEGEKMGVMGLGVHSGTSFICASGDRVMIHFPRKRCISVSPTRAIRMRDCGAEKWESLKDFEVRGEEGTEIQ